MQDLYENFSYISDPHGAVGYLGLQKYCENNPEVYGVFLETAHPVKFLDVVEKAIKTKKRLRKNRTHLQKLLHKRLPVVLVPKR